MKTVKELQTERNKVYGELYKILRRIGERRRREELIMITEREYENRIRWLQRKSELPFIAPETKAQITAAREKYQDILSDLDESIYSDYEIALEHKILRAMAKLWNNAEWLALYKKYVLGMPRKKVAEELGRTDDTVRKILQSGIAHLYVILKENPEI